MLAQNFMSASDLGIAEDERAAFIQLLGMLERGEIQHKKIRKKGYTKEPIEHFNMAHWRCGTAACIAGWAESLVGRVGLRNNSLLRRLFIPDDCSWSEVYDISPFQAAIALRSFLTTGNPQWEEALSA